MISNDRVSLNSGPLILTIDLVDGDLDFLIPHNHLVLYSISVEGKHEVCP